MNTCISYLYRDANNYKAHNECVVRGAISSEQTTIILSCLNDGEFFIPRQVGLPERKFDMYDPEADHPWFELHADGFAHTNAEPTCELDVETLVNAFLACKGDWKDSVPT